MKSGEKIIQLAWFFLGLLAVGAVVIFLGRPSNKEKPLATSFDPGGASAFAELLRRDGYKVEIKDDIPVEVQRDVLIISFMDRDQITLDPNEDEKEADARQGARKKSKSGDESEPGDSFQVSDLLETPGLPLKYISEQMNGSGNALVLGYDGTLDLSAVPTGPLQIQATSGKKFTLNVKAHDASGEDLNNADATFSAWSATATSGTTKPVPFANIDSAHGGKVVVVPFGELAMNSFIDREDNAKFLLDTVRFAAPSSKKIQILDSAVTGAGQAGLISVLGPWAYGIELQIIVLCIVVVYTLGKRFGVAEEVPRMQRGARDLLEGIADTYARSKAAKAALHLIAQDADQRVRRYLKLSKDAPVRKRNEMLPTSVAIALTACEQSVFQDINPNDVFQLARRLETELEVFSSRRRSSAIRRRPRVKSA